nr:MAG TPA: hypothetical protein [Caudoviricetes sp.]
MHPHACHIAPTPRHLLATPVTPQPEYGTTLATHPLWCAPAPSRGRGAYHTNWRVVVRIRGVLRGALSDWPVRNLYLFPTTTPSLCLLKGTGGSSRCFNRILN